MSTESKELKEIELDRLTEGPRETDPYSGGVTQALAGDSLESKAAFYSLDDADIRVLQKDIDKKSQVYIRLAAEQNLISQEDVDYLMPYFKDSMTLYGKFYDILVDALGRPQGCYRNDLEAGEEDNKNYSQTYITPSNSMLLTYSNLIEEPDLEENNVYLSLPGMKSIVRAVEKIKKGGKYDQAYQQDLQELEKRYPQKGVEYQEEKNKIQKPYQRLKDILRATISVPTYEMIDKVIDKIVSQGNFKVIETRDKFNANKSAQDDNFYNNKKNYRDKKICFEKNGYVFEIQFKVQHLEKADKLSHKLYEQLRQKLDEYANTPKSNHTQREQLHKEIIWLERDIQAINRQGIDDYNAFILETALKKDTRIKKEQIRALRQQFSESKDGKERDHLQKEIYRQSQSLNASPVSPEAEEFIKNNFMVRPYKAINKQNEFANLSPELQSFAMQNYFLVSQRYRGSISGTLPPEYDEAYTQALAERDKREQEQMDKECLQYEKTRTSKKLILSRKNYYRN